MEQTKQSQKALEQLTASISSVTVSSTAPQNATEFPVKNGTKEIFIYENTHNGKKSISIATSDLGDTKKVGNKIYKKASQLNIENMKVFIEGQLIVTKEVTKPASFLACVQKYMSTYPESSPILDLLLPLVSTPSGNLMPGLKDCQDQLYKFLTNFPLALCSPYQLYPFSDNTVCSNTPFIEIENDVTEYSVVFPNGTKKDFVLDEATCYIPTKKLATGSQILVGEKTYTIVGTEFSGLPHSFDLDLDVVPVKDQATYKKTAENFGTLGTIESITTLEMEAASFRGLLIAMLENYLGKRFLPMNDRYVWMQLSEEDMMAPTDTHPGGKFYGEKNQIVNEAIFTKVLSQMCQVKMGSKKTLVVRNEPLCKNIVSFMENTVVHNKVFTAPIPTGVFMGKYLGVPEEVEVGGKILRSIAYIEQRMESPYKVSMDGDVLVVSRNKFSKRFSIADITQYARKGDGSDLVAAVISSAPDFIKTNETALAEFIKDFEEMLNTIAAKDPKLQELGYLNCTPNDSTRKIDLRKTKSRSSSYSMGEAIDFKKFSL